MSSGLFLRKCSFNQAGAHFGLKYGIEVGGKKMEGVWYTHFSAGPVQGDGLAVLRDGEILGGGPVHTYKGSYQSDGSNLYANVCVSPYLGANVPSDLDRPVTFFLRGSVAGNSAVVSGHPDHKPDLTVAVELHRGA